MFSKSLFSVLVVFGGFALSADRTSAQDLPLDRSIHRYQEAYRSLLSFEGDRALLRVNIEGGPAEELVFSDGVADPEARLISVEGGHSIVGGSERFLVGRRSVTGVGSGLYFVVYDSESLMEIDRFPRLDFGSSYDRRVAVDGGLVVIVSDAPDDPQHWMLPDSGEKGSFSLEPHDSEHSFRRFSGFWKGNLIYVENDHFSPRRWVRVVNRMGENVFSPIRISDSNTEPLRSVGGGKVWVSTGNRVEVVDLERGGHLKSYPEAGVAAISADDSGCWVTYGNSKLLEQWRINEDDTLERVFRGRMEQESGYGGILSAGGRVLVLNGDLLEVFDPAYSRPVLELPSRVVVKEGDGEAKVALRLDRVAEENVGLRVRTHDGSATAGEDYLAFDKRIIIPAGARQVTIGIPILEDRLLEANESIRVEFLEPIGLTLPDGARGGVVIEGSGLQANPITLLDEQGEPVDLLDPFFLGDRVVADFYVSRYPTFEKAVGLFDRASGGIIHRLDTGAVVAEGESWSWKWRRDGDVVTMAMWESFVGTRIVSFDANTGQQLGFRQLPPELRFKDYVVIGPGLVFAVLSDLSGEAMIVGTTASEDRSVDLMAGLEGSLAEAVLTSRGDRYLVYARIDRDIPYRDEGLLRCFSSADDSLIWEYWTGGENPFSDMSTNGRTLVAWDRGYGSVNLVGIDMATGAVNWKVADPEFASSGVYGMSDEYFVTRRLSYGGVADAVLYWEVDTGILVEKEWTGAGVNSGSGKITSVGPAPTFGGDALEGWGTVVSNAGLANETRERCLFEIVGERTRPALELLNDSLLANRSGGKLVFRPMEKFDGDFDLRLGLGSPGSTGTTSATFKLDVGTHRIPDDGSAVEIPFQLDPGSTDRYLALNGYELGIGISGEGSAEVMLRRLKAADGQPRFVQHQYEELLENPEGFEIVGDFFLQDDRVIARSVLPEPAQDHEFLVIDRGTGQVLRRIRNPRTGNGDHFGYSVAVHGDYLAVSSYVAAIDDHEVVVFDLGSGGVLGSIPNTTGTYGFTASLAASPDFLAIGTTGLGLGSPSSSYVEAYRWSDFRRILKKSLGGNVGLGSSMIWNGSDLYAISDRSDLTVGGTRYDGYGQLVGYGVPSGIAPKPQYPDPGVHGGPKGELVGTPEHLVTTNDWMVAYRRSDLSVAWKFKPPVLMHPGSHSIGDGMIVADNGLEMMLARESGLEVLSHTRFSTNPQNYGESFSARVDEGKLIFAHAGRLRSTALENLGDFRGYRSLMLSGGGDLPVGGDLDGNGRADFDDYVAIRINPADPPMELQQIPGLGWSIRSGSLPPPDVLVVVELKQGDGEWGVVTYREGLGPWKWAADQVEWDGLVTVTAEAAEARVRYLPHVALGSSETTRSLPLTVYVESAAVDPWLDGSSEDESGFTAWDRMQMPEWDDPGALGNVKVMKEGASTDLCYRRMRRPGTVGAEVSHDLRSWVPMEDASGVEVEVVPVNDQWEEIHLRRSEGDEEPLFLRFGTTD